MSRRRLSIWRVLRCVDDRAAKAWFGFVALLGVCTVTAAACPPGRSAPLVTLPVVDELTHDAGAYTQGLLFADGLLVESAGRYGASALRRFHFPGMRPVDGRRLPDAVFAEGLATDGAQFVQLTWMAGRAYRYRYADLAPMGEFRYRGEGWGLTFHRNQWLMSNGTAILVWRDRETFEVTARVTVWDGGRAVTRLNEVEMFGDWLLANVWQTADVVVIEPAGGRVRLRISLANLVAAQRPPAEVLNGVAYSPLTDRLLVTGKFWPKLYALDAGSLRRALRDAVLPASTAVR